MPNATTDGSAHAILEAAEVSKHFGGIQALRDVSIRVRTGEITGLIGPNGAGKSTLLSVLGGGMRADTGRVLLGGVDFANERMGAIARHGLVRTFQRASPIPDLTVLENVLLGASQRIRVSGFRVILKSNRLKVLENETKLEAIALLGQMGLAGLEYRLAADLSFGQLRLLEIARALFARPKVLMLDEPVAGLNNVETAHLGLVLSELVQEGLGVLLVDHDIPFMLGLCKIVFVLDYGVVIASGSPRDVERNPLVRAAYLGDDDTHLSAEGAN